MKFTGLNVLLCSLAMILVLGFGACANVSAEEASDAKNNSSGDPAVETVAKANVKTSTLRLESSVVTGNRELPKVMSIVPWKKAQPGELSGRPGNSLLNELLSPVDREVFRRQLRYYTQIAEKARADEKTETAKD